MASAIVTPSLGLVNGTLGLVGIFQGIFPDPAHGQGTVISIKAGRKESDDPGMAGDIAAAYAFDIDNLYLGKGDGTSIVSGDYKEIIVDQESSGTRAEYVGIAVDSDAVCVAWVTVKQNDNSGGGAWTGDIGSECGQEWYEQNQVAGTHLESGEDYIPRCTWLAADHSEGVMSAAVKFSVRAYGEDAIEIADNDAGCNHTIWGPDNGPINQAPGKRATRARRRWMEESLVVSRIPSHRAENLCNSDSSWGPDFVGPDGYFCDMESKTLTPLCSTENVDGCVNIDGERKRVEKRSTVAKREIYSNFKSYKKIDSWD